MLREVDSCIPTLWFFCTSANVGILCQKKEDAASKDTVCCVCGRVKHLNKLSTTRTIKIQVFHCSLCKC